MFDTRPAYAHCVSNIQPNYQLVKKFLIDILQSVEYALTQKRKGSSTIAHSLDELELVHFSFDDPI